MSLDNSKIAAALEKRGWSRVIAGETDFDAAVDAISVAAKNDLGLIVSGGYGCGKTALITALTANMPCVFRVDLGTPNEIGKFNPSWQEMWGVNPQNMNVFLDDLGGESLINEYGVKMNLAGDFILKWHYRHLADRHLFITTNLTGDEIVDTYGGRVWSRLKDLCVPLRLKGDDKRNWKSRKENHV